MSIVPPLFSKFATNSVDLFKKKYDFDPVQVKSIRKAQNGVKIENGAVSMDDEKGLRGYTKVSLARLPWGSGEVELHTDPKQVSKISTKFGKLYQGLTVTASVFNYDKHKDFDNESRLGSVEAQYTGLDNLNAQVVIKSNGQDKHRVEVSASGAYDKFAVGGQFSVNGKGEYKQTDIQVGAEYTQDDLTATVHTSSEKEEDKTKDNYNAYNLSVYHKANRDLVVGGNFKVRDFHLSDPKLTFGGDYKLDIDTSVRSKLNLEVDKTTNDSFPKKATVSLALEHRLPNPQVLLGFATQLKVDSTSGVATDKFGFSFTLGDF